MSAQPEAATAPPGAEAPEEEPTTAKSLLRGFLRGDLAEVRVILAIALIWLIFQSQENRFLTAVTPDDAKVTAAIEAELAK